MRYYKVLPTNDAEYLYAFISLLGLDAGLREVSCDHAPKLHKFHVSDCQMLDSG